MAKVVKNRTIRQFREKIPVAVLKAWKKEINKRARGKTAKAKILHELAIDQDVVLRTIKNALDSKIRLATPKIVEGINKFFQNHDA